MTVEHSTLTGASLHEPKGVAAASSGTVYVANGLGSGAWSSLASFNAFGGQLLHVRDQRTSGSASQTITSSTWTKRDLQTTATNEVVGATLTSSVISLPAGTYYADVKSTLRFRHLPGEGSPPTAKLRLRNTTGGTTLISGLNSAIFSTAASAVVESTVSIPLSGRFTLAGTTNVEVQAYVVATSLSGGVPSTSGEDEVYTDVMIWKVA